MKRTADEWIAKYQKVGALWIHDENPLRPHVLLSSKKHSNGFFFSKPVIDDDPTLLAEAAKGLVDLATSGGLNLYAVDCVVGPATGATKLAEAIALAIEKARGSYHCRWASPVKEGEGGLRMVFETTRIENGDRVLLCEDVITTGGSVERTANAVKETGGSCFDQILALVNRSGQKHVDRREIVPLIDRHLPMWDPKTEACPYCEIGSEAIPAKVPPENWARLNATY